MINQAMFQRNGRAGFVLKPEALRCPEKTLLSNRTQHFFDVTVGNNTPSS
jgi:phosphatidylinositol phospholipase C delta